MGWKQDRKYRDRHKKRISRIQRGDEEEREDEDRRNRGFRYD